MKIIKGIAFLAIRSSPGRKIDGGVRPKLEHSGDEAGSGEESGEMIGGEDKEGMGGGDI